MGSRFYFDALDDSGSEFDSNDTSLPFPKPLARSAFLAADFDPATFLSSLSNRHQTLEDLRSELRELSQSLKKELLDLVNDNYQDFLSLGSTLRGGEEKVEEIRVGLLAAQLDLSAVRDKIETRHREIAELLKEKRGLKQDISRGRTLLEIAERIEDLEGQLMIGDIKAQSTTNGAQGEVDQSDQEVFDSQSEDSDDADSAEDGEKSMVLRRLARRVEQYMIIRMLAERQSQSQPFLRGQGERLRQIRKTLFLDFNAALKQEGEFEATTNDAEKAKRQQQISKLQEALGQETDNATPFQERKK